VALTTRDRILFTAKALFANKGYEHASTSAIAREAGTSESQLTKYFGGKQGLLEAIFIQGWQGITDEARAAAQGLRTPLEKLAVISATAISALERDQQLKLLFLLEGRRIRREGQMVALTEGYLGFIKLIDGVMYELHAREMLRPGLNPQAVRTALVGMMEALLRDKYLGERLGFPADYDLAQMPLLLNFALGSFLSPAVFAAT